MHRHAHWIWRPGPLNAEEPDRLTRTDPKRDANVFVHFRRSFTLDAPLASVPVLVSADGRYRLFVNGVYAGRGPARCNPAFQTLDPYDIAPLLRPGENVIAALVHSYGRNMSWYELPRAHWATVLGCGGFYFESQVIEGIDSDGRWRCLRSEAWEQHTAPGAVGYVELYDARRAIDDAWTQPAFDDGAWPGAVEVRAPGFAQESSRAPLLEPFPVTVVRDIPPLLEEPRDGARVIGIAEVDAPDAEMLALGAEPAAPAVHVGLHNAAAMLTASGEPATASLSSDAALTFVVDFGRDVTGHPRIDLEAPAGIAVDVSYAEQLRDDGRVPVQERNRITSQNVHRYITRAGRQVWEKFDRTGFRYLQLTLLAPADAIGLVDVRLHHVDVNFTSYPVEPRGAFACSDEALTRIWAMGAYTLQLCMQDGFEDCPTREQRQWVGDAYVEALVNQAAFGDLRLTARLLRQVAQSQMSDGMTPMATPGDIAAGWQVYIPDYCLAWIATTREYVRATGDRALLNDVFPSIERAIAWFERLIADDGLLWNVPGWIFIDWAEVDRRGACTALNGLFTSALHSAAELARMLDARATSARWEAIADRIAAALNDKLWDAERGVYADALLAGGAQSPRISQQANAVMIAAGIAPRERWDRILDYVTDVERLVETGTGFGEVIPLDEETQVVLAQPFFSHYLHRALAAAGRTDAVVENIRARWSPMLAEDGTGTMWEHWHGRESRCHAWSATPVFDLTREVLGVRQVGDDVDAFEIAPAPCGLLWAEGRYPAARGDIAIAWRNEHGRIAIEVDAPRGLRVTVVTPDGIRHPAQPGARSRFEGTAR